MSTLVSFRHTPPSITQFSSGALPFAASHSEKPGFKTTEIVPFPSFPSHPTCSSTPPKVASSPVLPPSSHTASLQQHTHLTSPCKRPRAPRPSLPLLPLPPAADAGNSAGCTNERVLRATLDRLIDANYSYRCRQHAARRAVRKACKSNTRDLIQFNHGSLVPSHPPPALHKTGPSHISLPMPPDILRDETETKAETETERVGEGETVSVMSPLVVVNRSERPDNGQRLGPKSVALYWLQVFLMCAVFFLAAGLMCKKRLNFW